MEPDMKLSIVSASILSLALLTGSSFAAATAPKAAATTATHATAAVMTENDTATIKMIDLKAHQLTLDDGKMFVLPKSWHLHGYKVGEKVKVSYKDHMGSMMVTRITKA
jgi:hypothetical protein